MSSACFTICWAELHSATLSVLALASPPAARIWSTVCWAGPALAAPSPPMLTPRSFTTTRAPWRAASLRAGEGRRRAGGLVDARGDCVGTAAQVAAGGGEGGPPADVGGTAAQ